MNFGFNFGLFGGAGNLPPSIDELLVWLKGNSTALQKLDSHKKPNAENFTMSASHCIALNGVDEFGTLSTPITLVGNFTVTIRGIHAVAQHGMLFSDGATDVSYLYVHLDNDIRLKLAGVDYAFTAVTVPVGEEFELILSRVNDQVTIEVAATSQTLTANTGDLTITQVSRSTSFHYNGNVYSYRLKDSTQDYHFRMAEGQGDGTNVTSFSDDYENDDLSITWTTSDIPVLWAQRQDSYHGNAVDGFGYRENLIKWSNTYDNALWSLAGATVFGNRVSILASGQIVYQYKVIPLVSGTRYVVGLSATNVTEYSVARLTIYQDDHVENQQFAFIINEGMNYFPFTPARTGNGSLYISGLGGAPLFTIDISTLQLAIDVTPTPQGKIVMLGDSLTNGGAAEGLGVLMTGSTVINSGINSNRLVDMALRFDADVITEVPDSVIIWGGINDITTAGSDPLVSMQNAVIEMCDKCTAEGYKCVLGNISPWGTRFDWTTEKQGWTDAYNAWVKQYASDNDYEFVDINTVWAGEGYDLNPYIAGAGDGLHSDSVQGYYSASTAFSKVFTRELPSIAAIATQDIIFTGTEKLPFLNDNRGGTFNDAETYFAPEGHPVGTFNGVDDVIELLSETSVQGDFLITCWIGLASNGANQFLLRSVDGNTYAYLVSTGSWTVKIQGTNYDFTNVLNIAGEWILSRSGTSLTLTVGDDTQTVTSNTLDFPVKTIGRSAVTINGVVRNPRFIDSTQDILIPINEGSGTDIHDSDGNLVGILSGDDTFWEGEPMVAHSIMDAEAASTSGNYLTDGNGHALSMTQQEWEADTVVMNNNKQYYFCAEAGLFINKNVLTDAQHLDYIEYLYNNCYQEFEALIDAVSGEIVYDEDSLEILYDEEA